MASAQTPKQPEPSKAERRVYRPPSLIVYGSISELTGGGVVSALSDHGADMMWTS